MAGLDSLTKYEYRVKASNAMGDSEFSSPSSVKTGAGPPSQIAMVRLVSATKSSLELDWSEPNSNGAFITGYHVWIDGVIQKASETGYTICGLKPLTNYEIKVRVINLKNKCCTQ